MEKLTQLQKEQKEYGNKLDDILNISLKKRKKNSSEDEEDLERAFETAFFLLKRLKTTPNESHYRIRQIAERHMDGLQILWSESPSNRTSQQPSSKFSSTCPSSSDAISSAGKSSFANIEDFYWSPESVGVEDQTPLEGDGTDVDPARSEVQSDSLMDVLLAMNSNFY